MEQFLQPLQEAFGYAGGIVILALAFVAHRERNAVQHSQEKRISENREHAKELYETVGMLREIKSLLEARK